jgi:hypothetical protein
MPDSTLNGCVPLPEKAAVAADGLVGEGAGGLVGEASAGFGDGAEHQHVLAQTAGNRHGTVDHASQRTRAFVAATEPVHLEPEGADQRVRADRRKGIAIVVVTGPAGYAVDVVAAQAGVGNGFQGCVEGQLHGRQARWAANLGLADAADGHILLKQAVEHHASLSNNGSQTSSTWLKVTRTGMSMCTSSTGMPTMLLTRRRPGWSASSTMATT